MTTVRQVLIKLTGSGYDNMHQELCKIKQNKNTAITMASDLIAEWKRLGIH